MQNNKRIQFNQKHEPSQKNMTDDDLFRKTSHEDGKADEPVQETQLKRQTYYLDDDIIEAIREMSHQTRKDKSELVRELLRSSSLSEYIKIK